MEQVTQPSEPKGLADHTELKEMGQITAHPPRGIADAAHLYQEDSEGRVLARLYLPRPTTDPRDPLTWGRPKKGLAFLPAAFFLLLSNYTTASAAPILVDLATEFNASITKTSYLITVCILFLGIGNFFWVPLALKIGKRPVMIASTATFFFSSIWASYAASYGSLMGARVIQSFGASASEAIVPAIVADIFFLHERGRWIGFCAFMIAVGNALGAVFAGLVATATGDWRWVWHMNMIVTGFAFLLVIFLYPETNFKRPAENETEGMSPSDLQALRAQTTSTWIKSLSVTGWYDRDASIWRLWARPFYAVAYVPVLWAALFVGGTLGWFIFQQTADGAAFPLVYNYGPTGVGNISIGYIISGLFGCIAGGPVSDWISATITKRRGGYFIPEFRLWSLIIPAVFTPLGLMLWGVGIEHKLNPFVAIAGTSIYHGAICAVPSVCIAYVVDCYRPIAGETVTAFTAVKNTFAFAFSFAVFPWLGKTGYLATSGYMLLIAGFIYLTIIPMYIYGPRFRKWSVDHAI